MRMTNLTSSRSLVTLVSVSTLVLLACIYIYMLGLTYTAKSPLPVFIQPQPDPGEEHRLSGDPGEKPGPSGSGVTFQRDSGVKRTVPDATSQLPLSTSFLTQAHSGDQQTLIDATSRNESTGSHAHSTLPGATSQGYSGDQLTSYMSDSAEKRTVSNLSSLQDNQTLGVTLSPSDNLVNHSLANNISDIQRKLNMFNVTLSASEKEAFKNLTWIFLNLLTANVTYFLYGGSLLGSYRHHGMIPWDDDLDLIVSHKDKDILWDILSGVKGHVLHSRGNSWKFYNTKSLKTKFSWKWPFLDIFFYRENDTHIWDIHPSWRGYKYLKSDIFPLVKRPFMDIMMPAPLHTTKMLNTLFDTNVCESKFYDHKRERFMDGAKVVELPCTVLNMKYPFVHRLELQDRTVETLMDSENKTLGTFTLEH